MPDQWGHRIVALLLLGGFFAAVFWAAAALTRCVLSLGYWPE
jgi:hypothetical protein